MLISKGAFVRALSQYNSFNNNGWLEDLSNNEGIDILSGDVRDPKFCNAISYSLA